MSENSEDQNPRDAGNMCLELALEGERLCKAGDCRSGVAFFQAAVQAGTNDLRTLSAIYSQLGNAYFYLADYPKALHFHKLDLALARTLGDKPGEAKSSGNLGNTLKVMGNFDEAMICCKRHLEIARELGDKLSEGRALYNLGNVYHAKGKHIGRVGQQDPGEFPEEVKVCIEQAVKYYEENLKLMKELNDRAAVGRACGNLGNTYYLLGNFKEAIQYHEERLKIAREFGDKSAERRANSNLGNSHVFLGEFEEAADHYKRTLILAQELEDRAVEAQACYSLGNTYTLLRDYNTAVDYHLRHLDIAQKLQDRIGEGRACWSLGNVNLALGNHEKALYFASKHLEISKEIGDTVGQATAQINIVDIKKSLGMSNGQLSPDSKELLDTISNTQPSPQLRRYRVRRQSMEQLDLLKLTPDNKGKVPSSNDKVYQSTSSVSKKSEKTEDDPFFDLLSRFQAGRMDDQRCTLGSSRNLEDKENQNANKLIPKIGGHVESQDDLLDMIAGMQSKRMDEQRVELEQLPGIAKPDSEPDDNFLELLMRCQGERLEDQRSELPVSNISSDGESQRTPNRGPTVPDEDFFTLIMRLQSGRMEDQRASVPMPKRN
ncbi:G-protein-signaling modulator 2 isoform X1 [Rhopalosiphum padi]|uniref:G-protein-signaling modulator 2 isoform X1 n=1 Tax=Rhopalosiphum padi TaxID=40932 RepID=UPI00298D9EDC|nr:G-protein-signaling modulator 2 isoform X1 [Rhopalosiphum padi]